MVSKSLFCIVLNLTSVQVLNYKKSTNTFFKKRSESVLSDINSFSEDDDDNGVDFNGETI